MKLHIIFIGILIALFLNVLLSQLDMHFYGTILSDIPLNEKSENLWQENEVWRSPVFIGYSIMRSMVIYGTAGFFISFCTPKYQYFHVASATIIILLLDFLSQESIFDSLYLYIYTISLIIIFVFLGAKLANVVKLKKCK